MKERIYETKRIVLENEYIPPFIIQYKKEKDNNPVMKDMYKELANTIREFFKHKQLYINKRIIRNRKRIF